MEWPSLLAACKDALIGLANADALPSISAQLLVPGASLHLKAGAVLAPAILSVKANLRPDAGSTSGAILAFDHGDQQLRAILASADLTAMRTAGIAAVAAVELLTKKNPKVALIGAGPVSMYTDQALRHLGISDDIRIWSRDIEHARHFASDGPSDQKRVAHELVSEAVADADLIITCTPSRSPLVNLSDLSSEVVVLAMGADSPGKRELGAGILEVSTIYADVLDDALRVGELAHLSQEEAKRAIPIGLRLNGSQELPNSKPRIVFDSVGSSAVDAAVVAMVLTSAKESGSGTWIGLNE